MLGPLLLALLAQVPGDIGRVKVCDGSTPAKCAPVSSTTGLKVDGTGATQPIGGVVVIDGGYVLANQGGVWVVTVDSGTVDLIDRAGRLVGHVAVDSLPASVIDGGSLAVSNFPNVQPVSGSVAVNNLPRTLSGAVRTDSSGTLQPVTDAQVIALLQQIANNQTSGAVQVQVSGQGQPRGLSPLNPFLPRCNAVVRTACQP